MASRTSIPDALQILIEYGEGLQQKLYFTRKWLQDSAGKISFLSDSQLKRFSETLAKKFPEIPDGIQKVTGYEQFTSNASNFLESTEGYFNLLCDTLEWKSKVVDVCGNVAKHFPQLSLTLQPHICPFFLTILTILGKVIYLMSSIQERRLLLAVHSAAFKFHKGGNLPHLAPLADLMKALDRPYRSMQKEISTEAHDAICHALVSLLPFLDQSLDINAIRTQKLFLMEEFDHKAVTPRPSLSPATFNLSLWQRMREWMVWCILIHPESILITASKGDAVEGAKLSHPIADILESLLNHYYVVRVVRDVMLPLHVTFTELFAAHKNAQGNYVLKKFRKMVSNAATECSTGYGVRFRRRFRTHLIHMLHAMSTYLQDCPALVAPKFTLVLGLLSVAKNEVLYYYEHQDQPPPAPRKLKKEQLRDTMVQEILFLISRLTRIVEEHFHFIPQYFALYVAGQHCRTFRILYDSLKETCSAGEKTAFEYIIDTLTSVHISNSMINQEQPHLTDWNHYELQAKQLNLESVRVTWFRLEASLKTKHSSLMERARWIVEHTLYVDKLQVTLARANSLHLLWSYRNSVSEEFVHCLKSRRMGTIELGIFELLRQYPRMGTKYFPPEQDKISEYCVAAAEAWCQDIADNAALQVEKFWIAFEEWDSQLDPTVTAASAASTLPGARTERRAADDPGLESTYASREMVQPIEEEQRRLVRLLIAIRSTSTITIANYKFTPLEYFRKRLRENLFSFFLNLCPATLLGALSELSNSSSCGSVAQGSSPSPSAAYSLLGLDSSSSTSSTLHTMLSVDVAMIQPSKYERVLWTRFYVLGVLEGYLDLGVVLLFRQVLQSSTVMPCVSPSLVNPFAWLISKDQRNFLDNEEYNLLPMCMIDAVVNFYHSSITNHTLHGCFSPKYFSFVSRPGHASGIVLENYTSTSELQALFRILGPLGFRALYRSIYTESLIHLGSVCKFTESNKEMLEKLRQQYSDQCNAGWAGGVVPSKNDKEFEIVLRSAKGTDTLAHSLISLGIQLHFCQLLQQAERDVMAKALPRLQEAVKFGQSLYSQNLLFDSSFAPLDTFASDCGVAHSAVNQHLVYMIKAGLPSMGEDMVRLLPYSLALVYQSKVWSESVTYLPHLDAYANNLHCLALGISQSLACLQCAASANAGQVAQITTAMETFVEVAALSLLKIAQDETKKSVLPDMVVILERTVSSTEFISRNRFDGIIPYSLVRSMIQDILRRTK